jgi:uncharacterized protein YcfJ
MRTPIITGPMLGAILVILSNAADGAGLTGNKTEHAEVSQVTPVTKLLRTPRQSCRDEEVLYVQPQSTSRGITGTVLGAIFGGIVGNQIGSGDGRRIATGVGTVAGAYTGNRIQAKTKSDNVFINTDRRCFTMIDTQEVLIGYDVRYRVIGQPEGLVRTSYDPGKKIPLRGGKLLLDGKTRQE